MIFHAALGRQWDGVAQYLPQSTSAAPVVLAMLMTSLFADVVHHIGTTYQLSGTVYHSD